MKRLAYTLFVGLWAMASVSCSAVRECRAPELNLPETLVAGEVDSTTIADIGWWEFYGDAALCDIIRRTLDNNKDMLAAAARVEQMRQLYRIDKASRLPEISARVYGNRKTNDYYDKGFDNDPELGAKVSASWELDLWGNLRWAKRQGGAEYLASVEEWRAMRMTLVAEVATAYFRLMALDNELAIVRQTLGTRRQDVRLAKLRFEGGLTAETVYQQAQVEYASTAALIPELERQIKIMENSISLLMSGYPGEKIRRSGLSLNITMPEQLPVGIPSGLLQRRPDVQVSEQQLRAALAGVGVAYADRFPRLTFTLTGGVENGVVSHIFESPFTYVLGSVAAPVFGFGRKQAKYRAALAAYDQARLKYEKKVLEVFKETDDAVVTYRSVRQSAERKENLRDAARKYVELANIQYQGGNINYIDVLDAQRRYFDAQIGLNNAVRDEHLALVQLYKTLGGGWTVPASESD
ncbi:efflux transporter outer membrane subunit [Alistipes sp.]|uniref:efflux transporter outer membrane subunit n=1 Tax=Alistipes sp. TaxID=1872444 RepID=UPI0025C2C7F0|nr:efflux transporter outer membrane subunit [Alistipes sp.]MCI7140055.1 efflux transporter outer membrane subunit [Alistipes sp.]MDY5396747.1 efflux transporter outer membrane subunit [Alistipes sp.]